MTDDEELENPRQRKRRERRDVGQRSSAIARTLMLLPDGIAKVLRLEESAREALDRARGTQAPGGRRREERRLAGALRSTDLDDLELQLAEHQGESRAAAERFQRAEAWRERLLARGTEALEEWLAEYPNLDRKLWTRLTEDAVGERARGQPRGAGRTLFRHVAKVLGS